MTFTVGRSDKSNIVVAHATVSSLHGKLHYHDDGHPSVFEDVGSTNGTKVDGLRVKRIELDPTSAIMLGSYEVEAKWLLDQAAQQYKRLKTDFSEEFAQVLR